MRFADGDRCGFASFLVVLAFAAMPLFSKGAENHYEIRFDQSTYHVPKGQPVIGRILLSPAPESGLFSYGFRLVVNGSPIVPQAAPSVETIPALNFNSVRGLGAIQSTEGLRTAVKGTVSFYEEPLQPSHDELLGFFRVSDLPDGPNDFALKFFNTLGSTEEIFVDGGGGVLDDHIIFGQATVNFLPDVSIVSPTAGESFPFPSAVNVQVQAADPDGIIREIKVFADGTLVATAASSSLQFVWKDAHPGAHVLSATATDDSGGTSESSPVSITIRERSIGLTAIFAGKSNKPAGTKVLKWAGADNHVEGKIHSNSDIDLSGNKHRFKNSAIDYVTGYKPSDFTKKAVLENSVLTESVIQPYPLDFQIADFAPDGKFAIRAAAQGKYFYIPKDTDLKSYIQEGVLREGLYFAEGRVHLDGKARGTVTIVATKEITVSGTGGAFDPYESCLWLFSGNKGQNSSKVPQQDNGGASGNPPNAHGIKISGSSLTWRGIVFAPNRSIEISGSKNVAQGSALIGDEVQVTGSAFRLEGANLTLCDESTLNPEINRMAPAEVLHAGSTPIFLEIQAVGAAAQLSFLTESGRNYSVESTDSLVDSVWRELFQFRAETSFKKLELPLLQPERFYRVRVEPGGNEQ